LASTPISLYGGFAPRQASDGEGEAGREVGQLSGLGPRNIRQFATEKQENAVGAFGENALARAPGPLVVSGDRADIFGPILDDFIAAKRVLAPYGAGNRGKPHAGLFLALHGEHAARENKAQHTTHPDNHHKKSDPQSDLTHEFPPKISQHSR
jgi:hypothetical protein